MSILPSYCKVEDGGIQVDVARALFDLPKACLKCGRYIEGRCAGAERTGISECRRGYDVYCDAEHGITYFGFKIVKGVYNRRDGLRDVYLCATYDSFVRLISCAERIRRFDAFIRDAGVYSEEFDKAVDVISRCIPKVEKGRPALLGRDEFRQIDDALLTLQRLKKKVVGRVDKLELARLFPVPNEGAAVKSAFMLDDRCLRCADRPCVSLSKNVVDTRVRICPKGCMYRKIATVLFVGLSYVKDSSEMRRLRRKGNRRALFEINRFARELPDIIRRIERSTAIRRFAHDQGQYLAGLRNVFPARIPDSGPLSIKLVEAKALVAFVDALKFMKYNFLHQQRRANCGFVCFSLYKMIDKYRLCFSDRRTLIDFDDETKRSFYERVRIREGFEVVVLNVLSNAVKYLPADDAHRKVVVTLGRNNAGAMMKIVSLGPPVANDELKKLGVSQGVRGAKAIEYGIDGEGLGLYAVRRYVIANGLTIRFNSSGLPYNVGNRTYRNFCVELEIPNKKLVRDN